MQAFGPDAEGARGMKLRSLLFVPGDSERKLFKSESVSADAIIIDLEDSVATENKALLAELIEARLTGVRDAERRRCCRKGFSHSKSALLSSPSLSAY